MAQPINDEQPYADNQVAEPGALVVIQGTTKDAERASKARNKHSTHSGHSMVKPVANSAA